MAGAVAKAEALRHIGPAKKGAPMNAAKKTTKSSSSTGSGSRRIKCACASCNCMVDLSRGVRKGNLVYCGRACLTECSLEECGCDHDCCHG